MAFISFNHKIVVIFFTLLLFKFINCKRNYVHSREEIKLTKIVSQTISQNQCEDNKVSIFIHSAARSSGIYYDRRQSLRKTWVKEAIIRGIKPIFVIGLPENQKTQKKLENESNKYQDMIQFGFIDNYYNLTLKSISILHWITKNCMSTDFVLKTDDDVLVNIEKLKSMIDNNELKNGITGNGMIVDSIRTPGDKWFMPKKFFPKNSYRFLSGFSYILSINIVEKFYRTVSSYSGPVLDIDDLFMTGIIADKAGIKRYENSRFGYYCGSDACLMYDLLVFYGCESVNEMMSTWNSWVEISNEECERII